MDGKDLYSIQSRPYSENPSQLFFWLISVLEAASIYPDTEIFLISVITVDYELYYCTYHQPSLYKPFIINAFVDIRHWNLFMIMCLLEMIRYEKRYKNKGIYRHVVFTSDLLKYF